MIDDNVKAIQENEAQSFRSQSRQCYVEGISELGISPKVDEATIIIGSSSVKTYVQVSSVALRDHDAIYITGKGKQLGKAIAVVEQVKQKYNGGLLQFNQANLHSSLINPAYKPGSSSKNIQVFLADDESTQESNPQPSQKAETNVLREIRGHKVYKVPSIGIFLTKDTQTIEGKLSNWSKQKFLS